MSERHVVITGAGGALGAAVVEALLADGATVHAPIMEAAWTGDPRVIATPGRTLTDEMQVAHYYASLPSLWASIHLVGGFAMTAIADATFAEFETQWRLNTATCFLTCREAVRAIRRSGGDGGRIVNVGARPAVQPIGGMISYATAKAGVAAITQNLAAEVVAERILVNAVLPSIMDTPVNRRAMPNADITKWPTTAEVARAIAFLASPANALTSGALVPVFGRS
jgi:NAD(P)-dependent dehydrogenase (short-subunit alcohol dehydrogenase family)